MSDPDDDEPEGGGEPETRPLGFGMAIGWGAVAWFLAFVVLAISHELRPGLDEDSVNRQVCVSLGFVATAWLALRVHGGGRPLDRAAGWRRAPWLGYVVAIFVGVGLQLPTTWLADLIDLKFPRSEEDRQALEQMLIVPQGAYRVAFAAATTAIGPLAEEILFRGALFGGLRKSSGAGLAVVGSGLVFALAHLEPRSYLPVFLAGAALGYVRLVTASLGPSLVAHMAFNGVTTFAVLGGLGKVGVSDETVPLGLAIGGAVLVVGLLFGLRAAMDRDRQVLAAREEDAA